MALRIFSIGIALVLAGPVYAGNFATCLIDKLPGSANEAATSAAIMVCTSEYPGQYREVEVGDSQGWMFSTSPESCVLKAAKTTPNARAAREVGAACRCLYGTPSFKGETCEQRQRPAVWAPPAPPLVEPQGPPSPRAAAVSMTPAPPTAAPVAVYAPSPEQIARQRADEEARRARQAAIDREVQAVAERAVRDFPYLDTPAGAHAVRVIAARRDQLIAQGVYPSIALKRAVNDFAEGLAPARPAPPPAPAPPEAEANPVPGCRWASPTVWSCDR